MWNLLLPLAATIGGAAIQHRASKQAQQRQDAAIAQAMERQRQYQEQAMQRTMQTADTFAAPKREEAQQQIAQQTENVLYDPVEQSQTQRTAAQQTTADVSSEYQAMKAASELETLRKARQLAKLMGSVQSAGLLRDGEAVRMADTAQDVDRFNNFARGQMAADQFGIERAGRLDGKKVLLGQLLQAGGNMGMAGMFGGGSGVSPKNSVFLGG
jgi:hypothetical protein